MSFKKKKALIKRWINIALGRSVTAVKQGEGKYYDKDEIKGYYNDLTGKLNGTVLDENGIPLTEIAEGEMVYFPIAIFQYGLAAYDAYLDSKSRAYLLEFKNIANWAIENQKSDGSWDAFGPMKSRKYSVSSMCQGEGASLLFRAAKQFRNEKYKNQAFSAIDFMLRPVDEGGTSIYEEGRSYLEEYPESPRRSVLNGWIFSIFGLYDAMLEMPDKYAPAFNQTLDTLCNDVLFYDRGFWSLYDRKGKIASPAYHDLHIALLEVLFSLTGRRELQIAARKFKGYRRKKLCKLKAVLIKIIQKLKEDSDVVTVK